MIQDDVSGPDKQSSCDIALTTDLLFELKNRKLRLLLGCLSHNLILLMYFFMSTFEFLWMFWPYLTLRKKWSFPWSISSVNVTKSAVSCGFGHICWRNSSWKTSSFVQCPVLSNALRSKFAHIWSAKLQFLCSELRFLRIQTPWKGKGAQGFSFANFSVSKNYFKSKLIFSLTLNK